MNESDKKEFEQILTELSDEFNMSIDAVTRTNIITDEEIEKYNLNKKQSLSAEKFLSLLEKMDFDE